MLSLLHYASGSLLTLVISAAFYYAIQSARTYRLHQAIVKREGCEPLRCLPNKWFPPFGLDKLQKVIKAEKASTYPLLMLGDHEKYGETYGQYGGLVYTIITRDPRNLRIFLSRQFKQFEVGAGRHGCLAPLLGDGIFTQDGPKWELSRKLLAPLLRRPTLPDLDLIEGHFQRLLSRIGYRSDSSATIGGQSINLKEHLFDLSLELTTEFLLGEPADYRDGGHEPKTSPWADAFAKEFLTAFKWIARRERLKGFYWMIDGKEFRESCRSARRIVDEVVSRSVEALKSEHSPAESYIALEPLLRDQADTGLIRDQFLNLLLAGRDTSGSLLCWLFYSISREPELAKTLRAEISALLGPGRLQNPTKSDLNQMTFLDQFVTETLRVFPPVPINCRFSVEATTLPHGGGSDGEAPIILPKGTLIAFSTFATHRSPGLYGDDAGRFRSERWNEKGEKESRLIDWSYHPFLAGPRKCLGEQFALTQAKYLTCRMLQYFDHIAATDESGNTILTTPDGSWVDDVRYHVGLTMTPDEGVWVRLGCED